MREEIVGLILKRLDSESAAISKDFHTDKGIKTRFGAIDNLLPEELARSAA